MDLIIEGHSRYIHYIILIYMYKNELSVDH